MNMMIKNEDIKVTWKDVAGYEDLIEEIYEQLIRPI